MDPQRGTGRAGARAELSRTVARGPAVARQVDGEGVDACGRVDRPVPPEAEERSRETDERLAPPHGPFKAALGLVLLHIFILITFVGPRPTSRGLAAAGGLVRAEHAFEPWRLITSLAVHADVRHLVWNALSLIVFAVPVIQWVGYAAAVAIYLAAGLAGGVAALAINPPGTVIVGSSGAIAGLFGAWLAITLRRALRAPMTRREIVRAVGIALVVLPTLLNPVSDSGRAISVEAHVGVKKISNVLRSV